MAEDGVSFQGTQGPKDGSFSAGKRRVFSSNLCHACATIMLQNWGPEDG